MANKENREKNRQSSLRQKNEQNFQLVCKKLLPFSPIAIGVIVFTLLLFFVPWTNIYNTDIYGSEVSVSGWSYLIASITGHYASVSSVYGDLAVPFYYYAESYVVSLGTWTLLAGIALILSLAVQIVATARKSPVLHIPSAVLSILAAVFLIIAFASALSMKNSDILPIFCSGNPACSIRSSAIAPALFAIGAAVLSIFASIRYLKAYKLTKE